jgi:hypothetical protein
MRRRAPASFPVLFSDFELPYKYHLLVRTCVCAPKCAQIWSDEVQVCQVVNPLQRLGLIILYLHMCFAESLRGDLA